MRIDEYTEKGRVGVHQLTNWTIAWLSEWNFESRSVRSSRLPGAEMSNIGSGSRYLWTGASGV